MTQVLRMSRKAFTVTVVAATIAWSIGLAALITPLATSAASSGDLIKASLPAVYYYGADNKRYVFPNEKTYMTWYSDFSGVQTITDAELAAIPIGGNVTYKPGVKMVKITTDPKVYAVDASGALRWVNSEAAAVALYGSDWNTMIHDIPDAFFTNYTVGADIAAVADFDKAAVEAAALSINSDKGLSTTADGALAVSLSASPPVGGNLPRGATGVNLLKFDVKNNGSSAVTVNSAVIGRSGPGLSTDYSAVYMYQGNSRLTTGRTINSSTHQATFSGLNVALAAGETKSFSVLGDVFATATSGDVNTMSVVSLSASGVAATGVPVAGPAFTMTGATVGSVTITTSSVAALSNVSLGGTSQKIASFMIAAGAAEDVLISKIALYQGGAVSGSDISNLVLKQAGNTLATVAAYDSRDRVTFMLATPFLLELGSTRTFDVYADIAGDARVGVAETILTYIEQAADVLAVGAVYGYGASVDIATTGTYDGTGAALGAGNCSSTRVEGGQVTITFNGPVATDIAVNGKDVELFNMTIAAQSNLEVRNLRMNLTHGGTLTGAVDGLIDTTGTAVANYSDIKVIDTATGAIIAGPASLAVAGSDTTQNITYTEVFGLTAGQSRNLKVTADVRNNTNANFSGDTATFSLLAFAAADIRNLDNSTNVALTDIVPNSGITGNAMTVRLPTLAASISSTPVAQTYIMGSQGVDVGGFDLKAGDASDMLVTSVTLQGWIDTMTAAGACTTAVDGTYDEGMELAGCGSVASTISTVKLMNGSTQLGTVESPTTSATLGVGGVLTFDNLSLTVPAGETVSLKLNGNISSGLTNLTDRVKFQVTAVTTTDADGNTVTASGLSPAIGGIPAITIGAAGTITAVRAPSDIESEAGHVVGSSSNVVLAKYKFTALNEELKATKLSFTVGTAAAFSSLSLYDGSTLVGGPVGVDGSGDAFFTGLNFVVPKDGSNILTVKGNLGAVGVGGVTSGSSVLITLKDTAGAYAFEARGTSAGSNTLIATCAADAAGYAKVIRKSKPTVSLVALPTTTFTPGDVVGLRFTVSADSAGDIALKKITAEITISATGTMTIAPQAVGNSSIRRVGDGTSLAGTSLVSTGLTNVTACTAAATTCYFHASFESEEVIAAGTSRTYDLRLTNGTTAPATGDSLSVKLLGDTTLDSGVLAVDANGANGATNDAPGWGIDDDATTTASYAQYSFLWSDVSTVPHTSCTDTAAGAGTTCDDDVVNLSSTDWTNGLYVKTLPTDAKLLVK